MIELRTYDVTDGLRLEAISRCARLHKDGNRCNTVVLSTLVPVSRIEGLGLSVALRETLYDLLSDNRELLEVGFH